MTKILILISIVFCLVQFSLTLFHHSVWPFSTHSLFSYNLPSKVSVPKLRVQFNDESIVELKLNTVLPMEYIKVRRIFELIYFSKDNDLKVKFSKKIINDLSSQYDKNFLSVYGRYQIPNDKKIMKIDFFYRDHFFENEKRTYLKSADQKPVYTYVNR